MESVETGRGARHRGRGGRRSPGPLPVLAALGPLGCAPTVDVLGVYFPGWLVSTLVGFVASYGIVASLGRWRSVRELADSGLLFLGLVAAIALAVWWVCFASF